MFLIGNKVENCSDIIRSSIGDDNIKMINDYFNKYYEVSYLDQNLKVKMDIANRAEILYQNSCYFGLGLLPFLQLMRINSLSQELDKANKEVDNSRKNLSHSLSGLLIKNDEIKKSNIYEILDNSHSLHEACCEKAIFGVEIEDENRLLDLVLNNELDLIKDYLADSNRFYSRLVGDTEKYDTNINNLDLRLKNITLQHEILDKYKNSDADATIVYGIIDESYSLLKKSLDSSISKNELNDYSDKVNVDLIDKSNIDYLIKKYIYCTKADILEFGIKNNNEKIKR